MRPHPVFVTLLAAGLIAPAIPAAASVSGRRNTAYAAGALALYELATHHTTTGLLAAAGAGYAYHQYQRAHKRSNRRSAYMAGYAQGVRHSYRAFRRPVRYRRR